MMRRCRKRRAPALANQVVQVTSKLLHGRQAEARSRRAAMGNQPVTAANHSANNASTIRNRKSDEAISELPRSTHESR